MVRPSSTAELAEAVRSLNAQAASQGRPLKIRATRDQFATMQSFPCSRMPTLPEAARGTAENPFVAGVLLNKMNKVLAVDRANLQMRVEGQITLKDFYAAATAAGLSIPRESLPWWQGLTLAGVMSTTSHGSGFNRTSMIVSPAGGMGAQHFLAQRAAARRQGRRPGLGKAGQPGTDLPGLSQSIRQHGLSCHDQGCPVLRASTPPAAAPQTLSRPTRIPQPPQCDWTVSITWVDAAGNVHVSPRGSEEARGICGGVGLVGIIAELTLQVRGGSGWGRWNRAEARGGSARRRGAVECGGYLISSLRRFTGRGLRGWDRSRAPPRLPCPPPGPAAGRGTALGPPTRARPGRPLPPVRPCPPAPR